MSFIKKTWLARIGVGLNRFRMNNSTDVVLESNPVSVTQQGDQLSADNMNNLETRIDNAFTEMAGNLAPIEVSPATTNHAVGTQLVYNGILYKVSSAISTGDNLVVGTNISPYPVSSAISDITDIVDKTSQMTVITDNQYFSPVSGYYTLLKMGKICMLLLGYKCLASTSATQIIFTVPPDCIPSGYLYYTFPSRDGTATTRISINTTNGGVSIRDGSAGAEWRNTITYICK